ncbi:BnaC09g32770D [Brassica napus]|uniref:Hexosyltransferase n=1 Tax=Brassica napus TaxID=3708 RepID=A0A078GHF8_BRANA|nr:BnaC09g32770D [Brassica napus]
MRYTPRLQGRKLIIPSFFFIIALCVLAFINEIRFGSLLSFGRCALSNVPMNNGSSETPLFSSSSSSSSGDNEIRILVGILTLPDQYPRRHFLRMIYGTQAIPNGIKIDVKFVFCNLTKEDQKVLVALEIMRYDDIIILNCNENMNKGKTYTYFSSLPDLFNETDSPNPPYHYIMKADDDIYIRLENLVASLKPLPREDLYYGYVIPFSWDIAVWLKDSEIPKKHLEGPEDKVFGDWMKEGRRGKNRFNAKWSMYNFPEPPTKCTHELWPDTIAVHLLKNQEKWIRTLNYFNVTSNLKPSKLYHIP